MIFHPDLGNVRYELHEVSEDPEEQVAQVIGLMQHYVVEDVGSPALQQDLREAVAGVDTRSDAATVTAIFYHVRSRVAFTKDEKISSPLQSRTEVPIVEALIRPMDMAAMCNDGGCRRVGDCDDFAMYTAGLLLVAGIPCAFVTVKADAMDSGRFSHVYVAAYTSAGRMALDTSHGQHPGWEVEPVYERKEWPIGGGRSLLPWLAAALTAWWVASGKKWRMVWA